MIQEDFMRFVVTNLYYLREKISDMRSIASNPDLAWISVRKRKREVDNVSS